MKRAAVIATLVCILCSEAQTQLRSISGELRYAHHYQDLLGNDRLLTSLRRSPMFSITAAGSALSPQFLLYTLRSTISASFNSSQTGLFALDNKQYYWDYYDIDIDFFRYSPVKINIGARDGIIDSRFETANTSAVRSALRRQSQRISLNANNIRFLPSTSINYTRSRSWSIVNEPYEQHGEQFSVGMGTSYEKTSVSLSGMITDLEERYSNFRERQYVVEFTGFKEVTEDHRLDVTAEYNRYAGFSTLMANGSFSGPIQEQLTSFSSVFARTSSSNIYASRSIGGSQSLQYIQDEHFRYGISVNGRTGSEEFGSETSARKLSVYDWVTSGSVQHSRSLSSILMSNAISAGYGQNKQNERRTLSSAALTNSLQTSVGSFALTLSHDLRIGIIRDGWVRRDFSNNARFTAMGMLPEKIKSQTSVDYRDQRYTGTTTTLLDRRILTGRQTFSGSFMTIIPLSAGLGGTVSRYFSNVQATTYGWNFNLRSNRFFVNALTMAYHYSRIYDLYYRREVMEQSLEFRYQWRALVFELRMKEYRFFDRRREVLFSVSRPF